MHTKTKKPAVLTLPLTALRCLYKITRGEKIVCEIDVSKLRQVNEPNMIDEMAQLARLEYVTKKTKGFSDTKKLLTYLRS